MYFWVSHTSVTPSSSHPCHPVTTSTTSTDVSTESPSAAATIPTATSRRYSVAAWSRSEIEHVRLLHYKFASKFESRNTFNINSYQFIEFMKHLSLCWTIDLISWVTESCWVGFPLSGWPFQWSEAVPMRQPGDWYLCPYLRKFLWVVLCPVSTILGCNFWRWTWMKCRNMNPENPDHLMRPDLRFQSLNDLVGRCEHATQAQCLFENLVVTHGTGESLTVQCRRCRAQWNGYFLVCPGRLIECRFHSYVYMFIYLLCV